jgi:hypothetical protein
MANPILSAQTSLAIILGAHDWAAANLESSDAFTNSARAILDYVLSSRGLGLDESDVLNLFDDERGASSQISALANFLRRRIADHAVAGAPVTDILIYYTGHGAFHHANNEYFLLVRNSESGLEYATGLQIRYLADCLSLTTPFLRKFVILDCCFAAAAGAIFQSTPSDVARQAIEALPRRGTLLFCSSNPKVPSRIEPGEPYTQFTGALNAALVQGSPSPAAPEIFSFQDLRDLVWTHLKEKYGDRAVRPALLAPDQIDGDLAQKPAIANVAKSPPVKQAPHISSILPPKRNWLNFAALSLVTLLAAYVLILAPFLRTFTYLNDLHWTVTQLARAGLVATIASLTLLAVHRYLNLSPKQCVAMGVIYASGGALFVVLARFSVPVINYSQLKDVINLYADGEARFIAGCTAVAILFFRTSKYRSIVHRFIVVATALWLMRYLLYFSGDRFPRLMGEMIIMPLLAFPVILFSIILLTASHRTDWKIGLASLAPPLLVFSFWNVMLSNNILLTAVPPELFDDFMAQFTFLTFVFPLAWTVPGLYIARPQLVEDALLTLRRNFGG